MHEDYRKESDEMGSAVAAARIAEALIILRMLRKAIKDGKNIEQFFEELDAYIEGLLTADK